MKTAASIWSRNEVRARRLAQKIIISHISNYFKSIFWKKNFVITSKYLLDSRYPCVPLPTYKDYEFLFSEIKNGEELSVTKSPINGLVFIAVKNIYIEEKDGIKYERHRPEDTWKTDIPRIAYLLVNKEIIIDDKEKRFKCRDMVKFLRDVRILAFPKVEKEYMAWWISQSPKNYNYKDYLKTEGYSKKKTEKIIRHNKNLGINMSQKSRNLIPKQLIREKFFKNNRKKYDKTLERLNKMGIPV